MGIGHSIVERVRIAGMPYVPGVASGRLLRGMAGDMSGCIVLTEGRVFQLTERLPAGLILVDAAPFSHRMIGLLGTGVPAVLITGEQSARLEGIDEMLIDGGSGLLTNDLQDAAAGAHPVHEATGSMQMADGEAIHLLASVRTVRAAARARSLGAESIGLVRSEFLQPDDGSLPDTAFYISALGAIAEAAAGTTVTVRLLDVAADKQPPWLPPDLATGQALGFQGARLYSSVQPARVIDAQLEALSELAARYSLRVIVPFIVRLEEFTHWLARVRAQVPPGVPVGVMAETPASVLDIDLLLDNADFVAIGCNDLMQTLFAADRDIAELRHYLDPYAPVLFRLFQQIAEQAGTHLARVQLCGLLPQIQGVLPVLLGLGYRSFSVDAPLIPHLSRVAADVHAAECRELAHSICRARTTYEVLRILQLPEDRHPPFLF